MAVCSYIENFLTTVGLQFENHVPVENKLIYSDHNFSRIIDSTLKFRHEVKNYSLLKNISQSEKQLLSKEEKIQMRKERSQLLTLCDELRDAFKNNGVQIKVRIYFCLFIE
ncbi:putative cysteine--tRNA ligase, mitochondrial, partial [Armadillidium vulgare]